MPKNVSGRIHSPETNCMAWQLGLDGTFNTIRLYMYHAFMVKIHHSNLYFHQNDCSYRMVMFTLRTPERCEFCQCVS